MHTKRPLLASSLSSPTSLPSARAAEAVKLRVTASSAATGLLLLWSCGWLAPAHAAGFGEAGGATVLGQTLDFAVQLRAEAGEQIGPECIAAEVTAGDRRLAADQVRIAIQPTSPDTARLRVTSTVVIDEPVITIQLNVGCQTRIARRFVVFADPPITPVSATVAAALPSAAAVAAASASASALAAAAPIPATSPAAPASLAANTAAPEAAPAGRAAAPRADAARAARAARAPRLASTAPRPARTARQNTRPRVERAQVVERSAAVSAPPRLKLEVSEPSLRSADALAVEQAIEAVAQAASSARTAASAASAAQERIASLERTVEQLRGESNKSRDLATQMREQLANAQSAGPWLYPLLAAALLLAAIAAWLAMRLAQVRREARKSWTQAVAPGPLTAPGTEPLPSKQATSPVPFVTSEMAMPPLAAVAARARPAGAPAWPPPAPRDPDEPPEPFVVSGFADSDLPELDALKPRMPLAPLTPLMQPVPLSERTLPLPPYARSPDLNEGPMRDVSIEELLDLEQQAEFFVVLGQDEAAVDLLVDHLRSTGGGSPLPYLKLLEIYHRRGDKDAYERTRARFNHRFNAYAPEWDTGLQYGRTLEDYTDIVPRLQQVWPRPLDAMAELDALLFRKSRGDMFDLPAYREVLFLYSLARDLLDREAASTGNIDLLLPLAHGGDFSATTPHPYFGLERDSVFDRHAADDRSTKPVDLDLTSDRQSSIFDTPDERTRGQR